MLIWRSTPPLLRRICQGSNHEAQCPLSAATLSSLTARRICETNDALGSWAAAFKWPKNAKKPAKPLNSKSLTLDFSRQQIWPVFLYQGKGRRPAIPPETGAEPYNAVWDQSHHR